RRAAHLCQLRLVVERFEVRRPARLVEKDDPLRLRRNIERVHRPARLRPRRGRKQPRPDQRVQSDDAESGRASAKKRPSTDVTNTGVIHTRQFLVTSSCRFSTARVTVVSTASWTASTRDAAAASPLATSSRAPAGLETKRFRLRSNRPRRTSRSARSGGRFSARSKIQSSSRSKRRPAPASAFCAKTRAASTKIGSLSRSSACSGVFDVLRLTVHSSRVGASKFKRLGCRNVRCQAVYTPRRSKSSPW